MPIGMSPRISDTATIAPLRVLCITNNAISPRIALAVLTPDIDTINSLTELSSE